MRSWAPSTYTDYFFYFSTSHLLSPWLSTAQTDLLIYSHLLSPWLCTAQTDLLIYSHLLSPWLSTARALHGAGFARRGIRRAVDQ